MGLPYSPRVRRLKKARFLAAYERMGNIAAACRSADIDRSTYYDWTEHDPEFVAARNVADAVATEGLEEEAHRRAVSGVGRTEAIYYRGEQVGERATTEYSDTLLIFLLKARAHEKYRDRYEPPRTPPGEADQRATIADIRRAIGIEPDP